MGGALVINSYNMWGGGLWDMISSSVYACRDAGVTVK